MRQVSMGLCRGTEGHAHREGNAGRETALTQRGAAISIFPTYTQPHSSIFTFDSFGKIVNQAIVSGVLTSVFLPLKQLRALQRS